MRVDFEGVGGGVAGEDGLGWLGQAGAVAAASACLTLPVASLARTSGCASFRPQATFAGDGRQRALPRAPRDRLPAFPEDRLHPKDKPTNGKLPAARRGAPAAHRRRPDQVCRGIEPARLRLHGRRTLEERERALDRDDAIAILEVLPAVRHTGEGRGPRRADEGVLRGRPARRRGRRSSTATGPEAEGSESGGWKSPCTSRPTPTSGACPTLTLADRSPG